MLIDSHCHIPHKKYSLSTDEIISEGKNSGVVKFITIGTSLKENKLARDVASKHSEVYYSVAIYPHEEAKLDVSYLIDTLEKDFLVNKDKKLVGIGECGIDISNWQGGRSPEEQKELFEEQIKLAIKYNLPLIVHNRNGDESVLELLNKYVPKGLRGVIHCFDSNWEFAQEILDLGFYISFSGMITYPKKDYLLEVVENIPVDKLLVETDAPYLAPQPHRGETNYPKYVKLVAEKVAEIKGISLGSVEAYSYDNTSKLFNL